MFDKMKSVFSGSAYGRKSYSQCGEDLIMDFIFTAVGITKPGFIDIGAHHPQHINNTFLFYSQGSRGINIEPDPSLFAQFTHVRPDDRNLNVGIGLQKGQADFYVMSQPTLNTFVKEEADRVVKEDANCRIKEVLKLNITTVGEVIREYNNGVFPELLSIDVEGLDEEIIRSLNYEAGSPKVMCVETLTHSLNGRGVKKTELIDFIQGKGYMVYADTHINTIFVRKEVWQRGN